MTLPSDSLFDFFQFQNVESIPPDFIAGIFGSLSVLYNAKKREKK
jgi:hypothetical protein